MKPTPRAPAGIDEGTVPLVRDGGTPRRAPLGARVRVVGGGATSAAFRLRAGSCVIGSGPASDLLVVEPTVSRAHVELSLMPEGVAVRDLGSRNGTFFHGQRVEKMLLAFGGQLQVGNATVVVDADVEALDAIAAYAGDSYQGMLGTSLVMRRFFAVLERLEGSLATVLVEGESGAGKELVAGALHQASAVGGGPFVAINCGAIPKELVASELFGHKRGAFSGAHDSRKGAFESAHGGTLFLDELGELPLEVQPMLLRALELGEVRTLGEDSPKRVKVRLVAATNRALEDEVQRGRFRADLFYRLAVVRLRVPPLRERLEDVPLLARSFGKRAGLGVLPEQVVNELSARSWPGNVRELHNAIHAYAALGALPAPTLQAPNLAQALAELADPERPYAEQKDDLLERFTRIYLEQLMAHAAGNQSVAARIAGLNRSYLGRLLVKHAVPKSSTGGGWDTSDG